MLVWIFATPHFFFIFPPPTKNRIWLIDNKLITLSLHRFFFYWIKTNRDFLCFSLQDFLSGESILTRLLPSLPGRIVEDEVGSGGRFLVFSQHNAFERSFADEPLEIQIHFEARLFQKMSTLSPNDRRRKCLREVPPVSVENRIRRWERTTTTTTTA